MGITKIKYWIVCGLLMNACTSNHEINDRLATDVLQAQIQQEARFDRSDQSETPKIKLLSVEVTETELLPKLVESDQAIYRVHYRAEIEILEECEWGTDRMNPRGFTRFITRPADDADSWMHITNATTSNQGDLETVEHFFELAQDDGGWVDGYNNRY